MKYVVFYDTRQYAYENRVIALSCANLVDYTAEILGEIEDTEILSPSRTQNRSGFYRSRKMRISDRVTCRTPPSFGTKTKAGKALLNIFTQLWLLFSLLRVKRDEHILVYHSLYTMFAVKAIKKLRKVDLILEIREIYSDAHNSGEKKRNQELKSFSCADKYIFATQQLNEIVNTAKKPYVIASGIYRAEASKAERYGDGITHVVYAGTLDAYKGGAYAAISSARYLPENYHVHILGNDIPANVDKIIVAVKEASSASKAGITYDGVLYGDDFKRFLQKCDIGLSTQNPQGIYNHTSFPSKVLTYLSNGLEVLTVRIPAVEQSDVGKYVHYYDRQSPQVIAEALCKIETRKNDTGIFRELDKNLRKAIRELIRQNAKAEKG